MCMQCAVSGVAYLAPTVAGLQVYKARVRKKRVARPTPSPTR
jgi:hypothetical protein